MRGRRRAARAGGGFTLIELLVALVIFSFIMTGLYLSLGTSGTHARRLNARLEEQMAVRLALRRLTGDLGNAAWVKEAGDAAFRGTSGGEQRRASVDFILARPPWHGGEGPDDGLALVGYSLVPGEEGGARLVRTEQPYAGAPAPGGEEQAVLLEGPIGLTLRYLDAKGQPHDEWPLADAGSQALLPAAVRVTLTWGAEEEGRATYSTLVDVPVGLRAPAEVGQAAGGAPPPGGGLLPGGEGQPPPSVPAPPSPN